MKFFRAVGRFFKKLIPGRRARRDDEVRTISDENKLPGQPKDWIPGAENLHKTENIKMRTRGEYSDGYPEGLIVHWTSGWYLPKRIFPLPFPNYNSVQKKVSRIKAIAAGRLAVKNGYNFLIMDVMGNIYQSRPLTKWGYHCGNSEWRGLGRSLSNKLVGIELLNPGKLENKNGKFFTWYGQEIPSQLVRLANPATHGISGYYCQYTIEQEKSLESLCNWLANNSPKKTNSSSQKVFNPMNILGHHEVSPGRKTDPGGSISSGMEKLRIKILNSVGTQ